MSILNAIFDDEKNIEDAETMEDIIEADTHEEEVEVEDEVEEASDTEDETKDDETPAETVVEADADALTPEQEKIARAAEGRLAAIQAERDKRQLAEQRNKQLEEQLAQMQRQLQQDQQTQNLPDPNYDPEGYQRAVNEQAQMMVIRDRFERSDELARAKYGAEEVEAAAVWAKSQIDMNPALQVAMFQQKDPLEWVVTQYKRDQKVSAMVNDEEAYFRSMAEKLGYAPVQSQTAVTPPVVAAAQVAPVKKGPKLANAASIGSPSKGAEVASSMSGILGLK